MVAFCLFIGSLVYILFHLNSSFVELLVPIIIAIISGAILLAKYGGGSVDGFDIAGGGD